MTTPLIPPPSLPPLDNTVANSTSRAPSGREVGHMPTKTDRPRPLLESGVERQRQAGNDHQREAAQEKKAEEHEIFRVDFGGSSGTEPGYRRRFESVCSAIRVWRIQGWIFKRWGGFAGFLFVPRLTTNAVWSFFLCFSAFPSPVIRSSRQVAVSVRSSCSNLDRWFPWLLFRHAVMKAVLVSSGSYRGVECSGDRE